MKKIKYIFFLFIASIAFAKAQGLSTGQAGVRVDAVLDSSKIRIGEQVKIDIYLNYNANQKDFKIECPISAQRICLRNIFCIGFD